MPDYIDINHINVGTTLFTVIFVFIVVPGISHKLTDKNAVLSSLVNKPVYKPLFLVGTILVSLLMPIFGWQLARFIGVAIGLILPILYTFCSLNLLGLVVVDVKKNHELHNRFARYLFFGLGPTLTITSLLCGVYVSPQYFVSLVPLALASATGIYAFRRDWTFIAEIGFILPLFAWFAMLIV